MSISYRLSLFTGAVAVTLGSALFMTSDVSSQDKANPQEKAKKAVPDAKLDLEQTTFMRRKLEASGQILEGLTMEDAELIVKGAKVLVELSAAERFQVQNDVMYRQFSGEFQRSARGLLEAAEKKNFDAAALKWMDTTMKCLECHKFVRGVRVADSRK